MSEQTEILIELVRKYPYLYDFNHPDYKNAPKKTDTWWKIASELGFDDQTIRIKWKNLRDCYLKYKKSTYTTTDATAKKYRNWPWATYMDFLDSTLEAKPQTVLKIENEHLQEPKTLKLKDSNKPSTSNNKKSQPVKDLNYNARSPSPPETPTRQRKRQIEDHADRDIDYPKNNKEIKKNFDAIDYLFLSYSETFKQFSLRKQALLKIEIANTFAQAELDEIDENDKRLNITMSNVPTLDCIKKE